MGLVLEDIQSVISNKENLNNDLQYELDADLYRYIQESLEKNPY